MATDLREIFPVLENADGSGAGITKVVEGDSASIVSGAVPSLVAKNSAGNLVFLQLDPQGRLPVTSEGAGDLKRARGELSVGNATTGINLVTGAQIILTAGKTYTAESMVVSCFRETHAQLVWNDNGVNNVLYDALLGPGQYTMQIALPGDEIVAGSGTQTLEVRARNTDKASAIRASLAATEQA